MERVAFNRYMTEEQTKIRQQTKRTLSRFGRKRGNLIPILQKVQGKLGYLPPEAMLEIAEFLNMPEIDVYSVVTFYNQFRLNPPGKHSIRVCLGTACHRCPAFMCRDLIAFYILPEKCERSCDACIGTCTVEAITPNKKRIKVIDQDKCVKCGTCVGACPPQYNAVVKLSPASEVPK